MSHRRRRSRLVLSTVTAAAAAVLVIGTFIAMRPSGLIPGPPPPAAEVSGLTPVMSSELSATVTLSSYSWGTRIDMNCTYGVDNSDHESDSQGRRQAGDGGGGSRRQPQSGGDPGGASRRDRLTRRQHLHPGRSDRRHPGSVHRDARRTPATESVNSHPTASDADRLLLARTCWDDADWFERASIWPHRQQVSNGVFLDGPRRCRGGRSIDEDRLLSFGSVNTVRLWDAQHRHAHRRTPAP